MLESVRHIIAEQLSLNYEEVTPEASLRLDLGLDSLDLIELIMKFASKFQMSFSSEGPHLLTTVGEVVEFLVKTRDRGPYSEPLRSVKPLS